MTKIDCRHKGKITVRCDRAITLMHQLAVGGRSHADVLEVALELMASKLKRLPKL